MLVIGVFKLTNGGNWKRRKRVSFFVGTVQRRVNVISHDLGDHHMYFGNIFCISF